MRTAKFLIVVTTLAAFFLLIPHTHALEGYTNKRLVMVSEPDDVSSYVDFSIGDTVVDASSMTWVDGGRTGKALSLSGNGETVRIRYNQLKTRMLTVEGWFYWRGVADGADSGSIYNQRLFTMYRNNDIWMSVMPHAKNVEKKNPDGGILNGIFLGFHMESDGGNRIIEKWTSAAEDGSDSYGLPQNEWHHVAVVLDYDTINMYIDGSLWFSDALIVGVEEMFNNYLVVGGGLPSWEDPTLNALVDNMSVYEISLSADQIALLSKGTNPLDQSGEVSTTAPTLPTTPTTSNETQQDIENPDNTPKFGLPSGVIAIIVVPIVLFIAATVFVNFYRPRGRHGQQ